MNREQLAHILRAASTIVEDPNILVIGSQSVLATFDEDELPDVATASMEVDLAYFDDPTEDKADAVDGAIGELSPFHEMNGVYAQGFRGPCGFGSRPSNGLPMAGGPIHRSTRCRNVSCSGSPAAAALSQPMRGVGVETPSVPPDIARERVKAQCCPCQHHGASTPSQS